MSVEFYRGWMNGDWLTHPAHAIAAAWIIWALSWFVAAIWSRQTTQRASFADEAPYRIVTALGAFGLFGILPVGQLDHQLYPIGDALLWMMFVIVVAGFSFCWWARLTLGALWSGTVTRKEGHHIVDAGPYALVRHPIYTGLLLAGFATAIARGSVESFLGEALLIVGCWMKARVEERFLSEQLGVEQYAAYRQRVHMLVPYLL